MVFLALSCGIEVARKRRKKSISDINIVPYVDVTLVLLVIFMATAPLLTQGVKIDLPKVESSTVPREDQLDPLIITVTEDGSYFANLGSNEQDQLLSEQALSEYITRIVRSRGQVPVFVRGDAMAAYGQVLSVLALAQNAGVETVNLITSAPDVVDG